MAGSRSRCVPGREGESAGEMGGPAASGGPVGRPADSKAADQLGYWEVLQEAPPFLPGVTPAQRFLRSIPPRTNARAGPDAGPDGLGGRPVWKERAWEPILVKHLDAEWLLPQKP